MGDDGLAVDVPPAKVGEVAAASEIVLHELAAEAESLEDVFLELTGGGEHAVVRLLASELVKLRTVRTLVRPPARDGPDQRRRGGRVRRLGLGRQSASEDPALRLAQAASFGNLFVAVIGILIVTNEYRHGTIMTTFLAEPHRVRVLVAKLTACRRSSGSRSPSRRSLVSAAVALPWLSRARRVAAAGRPGARGRRPGAARVRSDGRVRRGGGRDRPEPGRRDRRLVHVDPRRRVAGHRDLRASSSRTSASPTRSPSSCRDRRSAGIVGGEGNEFLLNGGGAAVLAIGYAIGLSALGALSMTRRDPLTTTLRRWPRR